MKIVGIILIAWGVADIGLSFMGTDLYGEIGIQVPLVIYSYTPFIAMVIGFSIMSIGKSSD
jgi:hypothetical protein